eukprot:5982419-Amphidinium_carterae.1
MGVREPFFALLALCSINVWFGFGMKFENRRNHASHHPPRPCSFLGQTSSLPADANGPSLALESGKGGFL